MHHFKILLIVVCLAVLVFTGSAFSQSARYGIGLNVTDFFSYFDLFDEIYNTNYEIKKLPVLHGTILLPSMRIDPELSFWRYGSKEKDDNSDSKHSIAIYHLGVGVSSIFQQQENFMAYAGGKVGIDFIGSKNEFNYDMMVDSESKTKRTDFSLGPCLGAEYFFGEHMSLGAEFVINYTIFGKVKTEDSDEFGSGDDEDESENILSTKGLLFLRWYF